MEGSDVEIHPEVERLGYFKMSYEDLERIDDAESMLERGVRLVYGIGKKGCYKSGVALIGAAERLGHPVARASRLMEVRGDTCTECTEGAARGHHFGTSAWIH